MISEAALRRSCRPAVLGRAQTIVQRGGRIWQRDCRHDGPVTHLSANVDGSSGHDVSYHATISFDEVAERVCGFSCTCPAAVRFPGPCKHSVALALDYNRGARGFAGYDALVHASTSPALSNLLDRSAQPVRTRLSSAPEERAGSVSLKLTLVHDLELFARFDLRGSRGSYVVRSISDLVSDVAEGAWHEYGKRLAFTHTVDAFDGPSRAVVRFLTRCVRNRRSFASERLYGHVYGTPSPSQVSVGREMRLSSPEADELIGLYMGREIDLDDVRMGFRGPLRVTEGNPSVSLSVESVGDGAYELVRGGDVAFFSTDEALYACQGSRLLRCDDRLARVAPFLTGVYCSPTPRLLLSERDAPRFAATLLPALEEALPVSVAPAVERLRPAPCRLEFRLDRTRSDVTCEADAVYGEERHALLGHTLGEQLDPARDASREADARQLVGRYFAVGRTGVATIAEKDSDALARLLFEGLGELRRMGEVLSTDAFDALVATAVPRVRVGLSVRANLIDLKVSADDLPLSELHALLGSYRAHRRFHRLRDGSFVDLAGADLSEAARLADELGLTARELSRGEVQIPSYKAFLLDAIASDEEKDASFVEYVDNFRSVDPSCYEPPACLASVLRPYQVSGYQWLSALVDMGFGGILADEMGLGKSVQLISLLLARRGRGATLVVCPASLVYNWEAEFAKFAPQLDVAVVAGSADERARIRGECGHEVLITSYDLLRRDIEGYARLDFWCEALDEAQYIKNHETLVARATKAVHARHRFALTGTPIENRLSELWSIFDYLMPGLLGSYDRFRERYEQPVLDGDEEVGACLRAATGPFVLRRLKRDVLNDLPEKLEQVVYARLAGEQRRLYQAHEQALRVSLSRQTDEAFGRGKIQVLAELMRLRQLCCDPRLLYDDYEGGSAKLATVMDLVGSVVDSSHKMLLFSQFTSYLSLIASELDARGVRYYTITGATPKHRRLELADAFNADETPVFLISLKAGGTGLNLVGASVVVHADPWWNAAAQDQATDRAHRIGQTRDVSVYKVIAKDTIEDRILALQEVKSDLAEQVIGVGGGAGLSALRKEDLIALLGE